MKRLKHIWSRRNFIKAGSFLTLQPLLSCSTHSEPQSIVGKPLHHTQSGFRNYPVNPPRSGSGSPGIPFIFRRLSSAFSRPEVPSWHVIEEKNAIDEFHRLKSQFSVTWLGHTTFLLRIQGKTFLTDPFLTDVASPFPIGPTRYTPPGISVKNLPPLDGIILSHNHYDHLDVKTIESLPGKQTMRVFVPLGMRSFFVNRGYKNVQELDWYQSADFDQIQLTALPAVHFSNRGLGDRNETLWCSWAITSRSERVYFAGDTAYSKTLFKEIGDYFKFFDMAIVPIGAYEPEQFMRKVHTNPEQAVQVALDVKADIIVPSHWGTIELTDEPHWEPPERYSDYAKKMGVASDRAWLMKIGETRSV